MDVLPESETKWQMVNKPVTMADDYIARLNAEGGATNLWSLQLVNESRETLENFPENTQGIVIGSGENTQEWKDKGWKTCDINPEFGADYSYDGNELEDKVPAKSQDFIFAEFLRFDHLSQKGVSPSRLLNQSNKLLKDGGILIIKTANYEGDAKTSLPKRKEYLRQMASHGFNAVVEVSEYHDLGDGTKSQNVIYYGRKVVDGYNPKVSFDI